MFGPLLPLKMLHGGYFFPENLKGAPQAVFVSRLEINLARKKYILVEHLKGAPPPLPRAVFLFKARKEYILKARKVNIPVEQLKGAPPPPPRAVFVFKGSKGLALCECILPERLKGKHRVVQVFWRGDRATPGTAICEPDTLQAGFRG